MNKKKASWRSVAAWTLALLIISGNLPTEVRADAPESENSQPAAQNQDGFVIENGVLTEYTGSEKDVVIPDGVKVIGDGSSPIFGSMVESVTIPASVEKISDSAFSTCTGLKSITFAQGSQLTEIGDEAFYAVNQVVNLVVPEGVKSIGQYAFAAMSKLESVTLPSTLETVGGDWFGDLFARGKYGGAPEMLTSVNFADGNLNYSSYDGAVYSADGKTLIYCPAAKTSIDWKNGVETIKSDAFRKSNLAGIVIPEGIVTIEADAFNGTNAGSVTFPSTLKTIGYMAFYNSKLKSIEFSEGLETIESMAFSEVYASGSISITLPSTLKSVGGSAFDCLTDSGRPLA